MGEGNDTCRTIVSASRYCHVFLTSLLSMP
nr:MAG TPA_asm: hypothetical protein [Caudoviricetes sp.]